MMRHWMVLVVALLPLESLLAVAPPPRWRNLTAAEGKQVAAIDARMSAHLATGEFDKAVLAAKEILAYRTARQGVAHWEVTDARLQVEELQRRASIPVKKRPDVVRAVALGNEGYDLLARGRAAEAENPMRQATHLFEKSAGKEHPDTARIYNNLGNCLQEQGKIDEAIACHRQALTIRQKALGEYHEETAISYTFLALCADRQRRRDDALTLHRKALDIRRRVLGEYHPMTGLAYNYVAGTLQEQHGKVNEALPFHRASLEVRLRVHGQLHPATAQSYMTLGSCYRLQGKTKEALALAKQSLDISLKTAGEQDNLTMMACAHVASCLKSQGKVAEALTYYRKSLEISEKLSGKLHPNTGLGFNNVGSCLEALGRTAEALDCHRKAREAFEKSLGPLHPYTANSYHNSAHCLDSQGKLAEASVYHEKALDIRLKTRGEMHPDTVFHYHHAASLIEGRGKAEAEKALLLHRRGLAIRARWLGKQHPITAESFTSLADCLSKLDRIREAADHYEEALLGFEFGRLSASEKGFDRARYLKDRLSPRESLSAMLVRLKEHEKAWQEAECGLGRGLLDALAGPAALTRDEREKLSRLRQLETATIPLLGVQKPSESQRKQLQDLGQQQDLLRLELARGAVRQVRARVLKRDAIQEQIPSDAAIVFWLDVPRLGEHLGCVLRATGKPAWVRLPGSGKNDGWAPEDDTLPGRAYAALTDPFIDPGKRKNLLDALHKQRLAPLEPHLKDVRQLLVIPSGQMVALPVEALSDRYTVSYTPSASLFARNAPRSRAVSSRPALILADPAFTRTREKQSLLRGDDWLPLPGTRLEARTLEALSPGATVLLGSDANEKRLSKMALSDELKSYRLIHLATHGELSSANPEDTALILAQDHLPDLARAATDTLAGKPVPTGRLTVGTILQQWNLDADLVTLSGCQTGLGQQALGEGMLGFAQALMEKGARSVLLSRWKVQDAPTALLMRRFYQNLLGNQKKLQVPMGRAEALKQAKAWLRGLDQVEAETLLAELANSIPEVDRSKVKAAVSADKTRTNSKSNRPFEHPYFWAAFVLVGDPR